MNLLRASMLIFHRGQGAESANTYRSSYLVISRNLPLTNGGFAVNGEVRYTLNTSRSNGCFRGIIEFRQ